MKYGIYILLCVVLWGCSANRTYTEQEQQAFQSLKAMVEAKRFEITSNFARPMASMAFMQVANSTILGPGNTASSIDITGNSNQFTMKGDTIYGYFPYFGEVQFGGGYPGTQHQGIEFKDVPRDYTMTVNAQKHVVNINFKIQDQYRSNEQYNVFLTLYANNRSTIQINSTNRSSIEYSGTVKPLTEDGMTP